MTWRCRRGALDVRSDMADWFELHIIPPNRLEPVRDERFTAEEEAQTRKRELEGEGCRVAFQAVHIARPVQHVQSQVTWREVAPVDVIEGAKNLGTNLPTERRYIQYRGLDVPTLLEFGAVELGLAKAAAPGEATRHAINSVHYAKMALDCLFDAYLERDFLTDHLNPLAGFKQKVELVQKRLGDHVVPATLISRFIANPRDVAQHERKTPTVDEVLIAMQAARAVAGAMTGASEPLVGPALVGQLGAYDQTLDDGTERATFYSFPPVFGLLWRGRDGTARAGVGTVGDRAHPHTAEVIYVPVEKFSEEEHVALLQYFDRSSGMTSRTQNEEQLRKLIVAANLDGP